MFFFSQNRMFLLFTITISLFTAQIQSLPSFDLEPYWRDISKLWTKYFCYIITMRVPLKYKKELITRLVTDHAIIHLVKIVP